MDDNFSDKLSSKLGLIRSRIISKRLNRRKNPLINFTNHNRDWLLQALNDYTHSFKIGHLDSVCKCGKLKKPLNDSVNCEHCLRLEADPSERLPKRIPIYHCRNCGNYSDRGHLKCQAIHQSGELLNFLVWLIVPYMQGLRFEVLDAKFLHTEALSKCISISLSLHMETPTGEKVDRSLTVKYGVTFQPCAPCLLRGPTSDWSSVVQLRSYATFNKYSCRNLLSLILNHRETFSFVNLRRMGDGIEVFFDGETEAKHFITRISRFIPIKQDKIHKKISFSASSKTTRYQSCIPALFCPICDKDLVFLPSKVSAKLGNIGPLVICTNVSEYITFLDPLNLNVQGLSADQYWTLPFEPLLIQKDLVKFIVLNVEIVSAEMYSLADIKVARMSDFGKNDLIFTVRSHLGQILKPGDFALGYYLYGPNINGVEAEKCRDSLPYVVLTQKTHGAIQPSRKVENNTTCPEYKEFLNGLEKNPEAMFNLSLNGGHDDEKRTLDVASVGMEKSDEDLDLEDLLAHLCLGDD